MLGTGLLMYMLSKEIYVINHETFAAASIGAVIIYGIKKFGPDVAAFADKLNEVGRKRHKSHRCIAKYFYCPQKSLLSPETKITLIQFKIIIQIDAKQYNKQTLSILIFFYLCSQEKMAKAQEVKDLAMSGLAQAIDDEKKEQWRVEGRSMLFDAKRVKNFFFLTSLKSSCELGLL